MPGKGKPKKTVRLDPRLSQFLELEAKQRGITVAGLIRAILEGYVRRKIGWDPPSFSLSDRALERVGHVKLLESIRRLRFVIAKIDAPALREKKLLEICDIIDELNKFAHKIKDPTKRLWFYDRIARFYRIFDMMTNNLEYDEVKRALDELEAEEVTRVVQTEEATEGSKAKQG